MPENDAEKFIEIIEKAKHFIDDDFEDLLEPLRKNAGNAELKEKMALLEEIDMQKGKGLMALFYIIIQNFLNFDVFIVKIDIFVFFKFYFL